MTPVAAETSAAAPFSPDADPLKDALASIKGLDVEAGLRVVRGKLPRYVNLLQLFVQGEADVLDKIRVALDAGLLGDAQGVAHALKGVAGNVGALQIYELAETINSAIRRGAPDAETVSREAFNELALALPQLLGDLQRVLPPPNPPGSASP